jgi:hypothetical protein
MPHPLITNNLVIAGDLKEIQCSNCEFANNKILYSSLEIL